MERTSANLNVGQIVRMGRFVRERNCVMSIFPLKNQYIKEISFDGQATGG